MALPSEDLQFAELLIRQGLCTREKVDEAVRIVELRLQAGIMPLPRLADVLVDRGWLTPAQARASMTLKAGTPPAREREGSRSRELPLPPEAAEAEGNPANVLGKYIKVERLGVGGMGEVWKAWDRELGRWVALKFLHHPDPDQIARFRREAQTAAGLNHPHIAGVYEVGELLGKPFIAMQYVDGRTLQDWPKKDVHGIVTLVRDAARAVHHAHEQGVIHRDLKPANLMVESSGARLFVMDFGLAKPTNVESSLSVAGAILGTPAYMPPEQARGESGDVTPAADVYSLGATLYELLAGRPPFEAKDVYVLLKKVIDEDPVAPSKRRPGLDRELDTITLKCLEKDPLQRYATAAALADDLTRWLDGEPILAHPPSVAYRVRKFVGRRRALVATAAAGVLATGLAFAWLLPKWLAEKEAVVRERETGARREAEMKTLGALWNKVGEARRDFAIAAIDPARTRRKIEDLIDELGRFIEEHPASPQGWYARGRARLALDILLDAEADLRKALELAPSFGPASALLARVLLERHSWMQVGFDEPRAVEARLKRSAPLFEEALRRLKEGRAASDRKAVETWGFAWTREDDVQEVVVRCLAAQLVDRRPEEAVRILKAAVDAEPAEEYYHLLGGIGRASPADAVALQTKALALRAHYPAALATRAVAYRKLGRTKESLEDNTRVLSIQPRHWMALNNRAFNHEDLGDLKAALADVDASLALRSDDPSIWLQRSFWRRETGDFAGARLDADRVIELDPGSGDGWTARAAARARGGDLDGAIADATKALEVSPEDSDAYGNRGSARLEKGDLAGAEADTAKAVALDPKKAVWTYNLGGIRMAQGRMPDALRLFRDTVKLDPKHGGARAHLAKARLEEGDVDGALADLDALLTEKPQLVEGYQARAAARYRKGDHDGAVKDLTQVLEILPRDFQAWYNRGGIRERSGDLKGGVADFKKALECAPPDWPRRAAVERQLERARQAGQE